MADDPLPGIALDGGVASDVVVVETPDGPIVVKRALAKLKVATEWKSDPARSLIEVAAIRAFARLGGPDTVPRIVWVRPEDHCFAMELVDKRLRNWKTDLLAGHIDPATAARVGEILAEFHANSANQADLAQEFSDLRFFRELRIEPFFEFVAERRPDLAAQIRQVAAGLQTRRKALVHGDFSPKNILADGSDVVILDFEVTHWGDPRFDVGFCISHLILKAALNKDFRERTHQALATFLQGYRKCGPDVIDVDLAKITACLLLARLFGKSPPDYRAQLNDELVEAKAIALMNLGSAPGPTDFFFLPEG